MAIPNSTYGLYKKFITPEGLEELKDLYRTHKFDTRVAKALGIHIQTINKWKEKFPEILEAIREVKAEDDDQVERRLYDVCNGLTINKTIIDDQGKVKTIQEELPPDITAIKFYLTNRRPDQWRNKIDSEVSGALPVVITGEDELKD